MIIGERPRWALALAGVLMWLALPLVNLFGGIAKHAHHCHGRVFTGAFDECFNDYLPILELFVAPLLVVLLAYLFARFAYTLFGLPPDRRRLKWRLAIGGGALAVWPIFQVLAGIGLAWTIWRLLTYPLAPEMTLFLLYWGAFAAWFVTGIAISFADKKAALGAETVTP